MKTRYIMLIVAILAPICAPAADSIFEDNPVILPADILLGKDDLARTMPVAERAKDGSAILSDLDDLPHPATRVAEGLDPDDGNTADFSTVRPYRATEVCSGMMSQAVYQSWLEGILPNGRNMRLQGQTFETVRYPIYKMPDSHRILGFCCCNHRGMRNILRTDGSVELVGPKLFIAKVHADARHNGIALDPGEATVEEEHAVAAAIKGLGDDDFDRRESAMQELRELCNVDGPAIERGAESDNLEIASRCKRLLIERRRSESTAERIRAELKVAAEAVNAAEPGGE